MFKRFLLLLALGLFWVPSERAALRPQHIAALTAGATISYLYLHKNNQKIGHVLHTSAVLLITKTSDAVLTGKKWLTTKISEHTNRHALMLEALSRLEKQVAHLEQQNRVLLRQNALMLTKMYEAEALVTAENQPLPENHSTKKYENSGKIDDSLTNDNQAHELALTRAHKDGQEEPDDDPLTSPGIIIMETDNN